MTAAHDSVEQPAPAPTTARLGRYAADTELVARNVATIERVQQTLRDLRKKWASIDVHMESADGDVQLSVNHHGRLMSLSLAPGCTTRHTNEGLEQLITTTLQAAVADAYAEREVIEQHAEEAAREAAKLLDNLQ
ncbi:YbaB/EbfC family nucleoid-associated protein [Mycolicibacterium goodii]|uniref:YbaB/EbfC family nucleoid-associated protein n=1 Tax=Mycolicibacterium goodii TaxID=134601 RepID=UPI001BDDC965|nr:YbaB/EbfC family nucleoid-associated protein [Mycolicibacterium goodii]MBU8841444.1 YbaB/EbfC family nucleoid-associated protein [Mycolicibacterium goodii]